MPHEVFAVNINNYKDLQDNRFYYIMISETFESKFNKQNWCKHLI